MFNSTTLEVAIGLALVYLIVSLFCTAVNEAIAGILNTRARNLERGIRSLFTEGNLQAAVKVGSEIKSQAVTLTDALYNHGLVQSLYRCSGTGDGVSAKNLKKPPSYIPSRTFASALYDILFSKAATAALDPDELGEKPEDEITARLKGMLDALNALPDGAAKQAILTLVKEAKGDAAKTRQAFERWYDDGMDRAAGWYKKNTQMSLFIIGLGIAVVLNVDSVNLGRALWTTPALRAYTVSMAEQYGKNHTTPKPDSITPSGVGSVGASTSAASSTSTAPVASGTDATTNANGTDSGGATAPAQTVAGSKNPQAAATDAASDLSFLNTLNLPIGWSEQSAKWWSLPHDSRLFWYGLLLSMFGWLLTGIAVTLGAPFWFDTLNQIMVVRSTIKPREKSEVEASKDPKAK